MNGIHDMGGMDGFGAVEREEGEPVFHARWAGRVRGLVGLGIARRLFSIDAFRHAIETMRPDAYLRSSYDARWLHAAESLFERAGAVKRSEVEEHVAALRAGRTPPPAPPAEPPTASAGRPGFLREGEASPRFRVGSLVRARNLHPIGHTRLPRYVRGREGVVERVHPPCVFPDTNAHGRGEHPQCVYNVGFDAAELFGEEAEAHSTVRIDLFESYLEPI